MEKNSEKDVEKKLSNEVEMLASYYKKFASGHEEDMLHLSNQRRQMEDMRESVKGNTRLCAILDENILRNKRTQTSFEEIHLDMSSSYTTRMKEISKELMEIRQNKANEEKKDRK